MGIALDFNSIDHFMMKTSFQISFLK